MHRNVLSPPRRRPRLLPLLAVLAVASWPAVAAADPQCDPFKSIGCFVVTTFILSIFVLPIGVSGSAVIIMVSVKRKANSGLRLMLLSLFAVPAAYVSMLGSIALFPEGLLPILIAVLFEAAYVWFALRLLPRRPAAAA